MDRTARAARAVDAGLGACQKSLNLAQLRIGLLQLGRAAGDHVQAVMVADGHLIGQPAEIPRERGDALGELETAAAQLGDRAVKDARIAGGQDNGEVARSPES